MLFRPFGGFVAIQKAVSYLRVSTGKQGRTGLGVEAQREAVREFLTGGMKLVEEVVEVESGRRSDRPELQRALALCQTHKAILVVAKLDRLARDAHFLLGLKDAGVEFVCCDMPSANRLTVGILAMVAEEEARMISARTKAALAAAKRRGVRLGRPNLTPAARVQGYVASARVRHKAAQRRAIDLTPTIAELEGAGVVGPTAIARELNRRDIPAPRGGLWSATQVSRLRRIARH